MSGKGAHRPQSVSEVLGIKPFYPDKPRADFRTLLDETVIIDDAMIIEDYESEYGTHDLALFLFHPVGSNDAMTSACSGQVVVKKLRQLAERDLFPVTAVFHRNNRYYDMK